MENKEAGKRAVKEEIDKKIRRGEYKYETKRI